MAKVYIASGWFTPQQENDLAIIEQTLLMYGIDAYSPRKQCMLEQAADFKSRDKVYNDNIQAIDDAEYVIVNTRDKDMGSIFEAGMAAAWGKTIIYVAFHLDNASKFNLMLAQSGSFICTNIDELECAMRIIMLGVKPTYTYHGLVE